MLQTLKTYLNSRKLKQLADPRNIVLYIFVVIVLAISWSTVRTIQVNYQLQKKISYLNQQNEVLRLSNGNTALRNQYLQTNEYLDFEARQTLGLAAPGEKVLLISPEIALKYVDKDKVKQITQPQPEDNRSKVIKNLADWRDFLLGRKLFQD